MRIVGLLASDVSTSLVEVTRESINILSEIQNDVTGFEWAVEQKLYALCEGAFALVRPNSERKCLLIADSTTKKLRPLGPLPGTAPVFTNQCAGHSDGSLTFIEIKNSDGESRKTGKTESILWINDPGFSYAKWTPVLLPPGFFLGQVSKDPSGGFHMIGSLPSMRRDLHETESAYAVFKHKKIDFIKLNLASEDINALERNGFVSEFSKINATKLPALISSENIWGWDDPTSVVIIAGSRRAFLRVFKKSIAYMCNLHSKSVVFSNDGYQYCFLDGGEKWSEQSYMPFISKVWPKKRLSNVLISSVDSGNNGDVVIVANYIESKEPQSWECGIFISRDSGKTFEFLQSAPRGARFLNVIFAA